MCQFFHITGPQGLRRRRWPSPSSLLCRSKLRPSGCCGLSVHYAHVVYEFGFFCFFFPEQNKKRNPVILTLTRINMFLNLRVHKNKTTRQQTSQHAENLMCFHKLTATRTRGWAGGVLATSRAIYKINLYKYINITYNMHALPKWSQPWLVCVASLYR